MNNLVFSTGGDWDSTTLANDGQEVLAAQLFVELHAGRDGYNEPSGNGIFDGGELNAIVRPQEDSSQEIGVFPGRLEMKFPGHAVVMENLDPMLSFTATRVWFDGRDVSNRIMDLYIDVNAVDNVVQASVTLYHPHWFSTDEVATVDLL
jgi:hypothetical protein